MRSLYWSIGVTSPMAGRAFRRLTHFSAPLVLDIVAGRRHCSTQLTGDRSRREGQLAAVACFTYLRIACWIISLERLRRPLPLEGQA